MVIYHSACSELNDRSCVLELCGSDDVGENVRHFICFAKTMPARLILTRIPLNILHHSADYAVLTFADSVHFGCGWITTKYAGSRFSGAGDRSGNTDGQTRSPRLRGRNPKTRTVYTAATYGRIYSGRSRYFTIKRWICRDFPILKILEQISKPILSTSYRVTLWTFVSWSDTFFFF